MYANKHPEIGCFGDRETHATSRIDSADAAGAMCDIQIFESLVLKPSFKAGEVGDV